MTWLIFFLFNLKTFCLTYQVSPRDITGDGLKSGIFGNRSIASTHSSEALIFQTDGVIVINDVQLYVNRWKLEQIRIFR